MWKKTLISLALAVAPLSLPAQSGSDGVTWASLPQAGAPTDTAYRKGVSAAYAGLIGHRLVLAGGCNFPDRPAADGGAKRYYDDVFVLATDTAGTTWHRVGRMPAAAAYGATLPTDDGLAFIGGTGPNGPTAQVAELRLTANGATAEWSALPALPVSLDNMGGARLGRRLYIAGGNADGVPSRRVFSLSLDNPEAGWHEEEPIPGPPRVQPVAVALRYKGEMCLYVFGGFAAGSADREPSLSLDALRYTPSTRRWTRVAPPVDEKRDGLALGGGAGYAWGDTAAVCLGGVNKSVFLDALRREAQIEQARTEGNDRLRTQLEAAKHDYMTQSPAWHRFNSRVLRYSADTDRWTVVGHAGQAARAGAALVGNGDTFYWLGGELKPGVRTPDLWQGKLK